MISHSLFHTSLFLRPRLVAKLHAQFAESAQLEQASIGRDVSQQYRRTLLRGGEILVSLVGNPGQVAIAPPELAIEHQSRTLATLRDTLQPKLLSGE